MLDSIKLFGVSITNANENEILEYIYNELRDPRKKLYITTPNPEIIVYAQKHPAFKAILNKASVSLPDGVGVFIAAGLFGTSLKERIAGTDFVDRLCNYSVKNPISIGFLGGGPGVAHLTAERLKKRYPTLNVVFAREEWDSEIEKKLHVPLDVLLVAYGFPKQEEWIHENISRLPIKAAMGVGGAFDYISGTIPRAPYLIRAMGFEWAFRLILQPWRIKRQLALIEFSSMVLRHLLFKSK